MATNNVVRNFDKYIYGLISGFPEYDFKDKQRAIRHHITYMLNRTQSMFKWDGLPDTIPERSLELYLQINGNACFYKYGKDLYVFTGGLGGEPDAYYMPTIYTIVNPALKLSVQAKIGKDCVVMPNDRMYIGLMPMYSRYATQLAETELSMRCANINSRIIDLISAPDDRTKASAEKFLDNIEKGDLGIIAENAFLDGIKAQPYGSTSNSNTLTNLIEFEQYTKASWYNDIGINANYNMKRESLNSAESQLNNDALLPLVDDMLRCRQEAAEKVNKMFGTNISVSLDSSWEDNELELEAAQEQLSAGQASEEAEQNNTEEMADDSAQEEKMDDPAEEEKDGDEDDREASE